MQRVFHARLLFLHLHFGRGTDFDQRNAAGQLGDTLLQLFAVVVAGGFVDLLADVLHTRFDLLGIAGAVDDRGFFLADFDALGLPQIIQGGLLQLQADFVGDHRAAGQDGDVFQHGLAAIAEARCLHAAGLQNAADVVDHQCGERFAFDVFSDDQQRTTGLGYLLEHRQQIADAGDLLVVQQDVGIVENCASASRDC